MGLAPSIRRVPTTDPMIFIFSEMLVPTPLVSWVFRNIDPSSRLADRLPVPVEITKVRVTADAILIGD